MGSYSELTSKVKELSKVLSAKNRPEIPKNELEKANLLFNQISSIVDKYRPPTTKEKQEAKSHPISSQIVTITSDDATRKKIFNKTYFETLYKALPDDKKRFSYGSPKTIANLRDTIICYHYFNSKNDNLRALKELRDQLQSEYAASPEIKKQGQANELFRSLMAMNDVDEVAVELEKQFKSANDLKEFAKLIGMKIPPQSRKKGAPKTTAHERLAKAIHKQGGVARMRLSKDG